MNSRFVEIIRSAPTVPIIVVGDIILDTYIAGRTERISPEAPIQVLDVGEESRKLGGAANVAANLKAMGAEVECCGVIGADRDGDLVLDRLNELGIGTRFVLRDPGRPTVCKTRVVSRNQQLLRIDREMRRDLDAESTARLLGGLSKPIFGSAAVVLSDYAKGTLTPELIGGIVKRAERSGGAGVLVDPKGRDFSRYRGARLITPNKKEAEEYSGALIAGRDGLEKAAALLRRDAGVREVVITLGAEGIFYSSAPGEGALDKALSRSVYDVTGAGDTVIALLSFFLASGCSLGEAVRIANAGAGIVVGRPGTSAPTRAELVESFLLPSVRPAEKILSRAEAAQRAASLREGGGKLVLTNGCFDLIHGGHLAFLRAAKAAGDRLMVAVNDDDSVRRLKGPTRPVLDLSERMEILASLQVVDYVVSFSEDTPLEVVREVSPDILVKGDDWREKGIVGREWVESHGGEVRLVELREGKSTSRIIERILDLHGKEGHAGD